jgi:hypothetical protein
LKTIGEVNQDTLKLQNHIEPKAAGTVLGYDDIQRETGIRMDTTGKARLRQALKRSRREYSCIRGYGIRLAASADVMPILSTRITRIDSAVKRADRTQKILQEQFFSSLSEHEQRKILFAGAVFGAIRIAAEQGKQIQGKGSTDKPTVHIPLPMLG